MKASTERADIIEWISIIIILMLALLIVMMTNLDRAQAHDQWADGSAIPAWVKSSCCGPADAHHLRPDQVYDMGDYYVVDGYREKIPKLIHDKPNTSILPSQDGDYWIFYSETTAGKVCSPEAGCSGWQDARQSGIFCFFVPMSI